MYPVCQLGRLRWCVILMSFYAHNTREKAKKPIFKALKNRKRGFSRGLTPMSLIALLALITVFSEGVAPAISAPLSAPRALGTTETLNVYPAHVMESEWQGYEHVLSADISSDGMYQDFSERNAAYVSETLPDPEAVVQQLVPTSAPAATATQTPADTSLPPAESVPSAASSSSEPAADAATSADGTVTTPATQAEDTTIESVPTPDPAATEVPAPTEVTPDSADPAPASEPEVVPDAEPATAPDAPVSFGFGSWFGALFTIPTAHAQTTTPEATAAVTAASSTVGTEPVSAEQPAVPTVSVRSTSTTASELTTEVATTTAPASSGSTSTSTTPAAETVAASDTRTITLGDFSTPPLEPGQFLRNAQLRVSFAGKLKPHATGTLPTVTFTAETPSGAVTLGSVVIDDEVSNAINGGHYLFALPSQANLAFLDGFEVTAEFNGDLEMVDGVYLDALWLQLEIETVTKADLERRANEEVVHTLKQPTMYEFASESRDFLRDQNPVFNLRYVSQRSKAVEAVRDFLGRSKIKVDQVAIKHHGSGEIGIVPDVTVTKDGLVSVVIPDEERKKLKPGVYEVEITVNEGGERFTDSFEFQWGLLAINTNQTVYQLGDTVAVSAGALTLNGNTMCEADLRLYVIAPDGSITQQTVDPSGQCNGNNVVDVPDYSTTYVPIATGDYDLYLERVSETGEVQSHTSMSFAVEKTPALVIDRVGPTRIFPPSPYPMQLTITAEQSFTGVLTERVPNTFKVDAPEATIEDVDGYYELSWDVAMLAGSEKTVSYTFDAPDISPFLYEVGPAELVSTRGNSAPAVAGTSTATTSPTVRTQGSGSFIESRQWQIASDAVGQMLLLWDGASVPTDWSCVSCTSGDPFFQRFVMGSSTGSVTGGSATHTHTAVGSVLASPDTSTEGGSGTVAPSGHTHTYTPTIGSASNLPSYRQLQVIQYQPSAGEPPTLPAGAIGVFDASVPTGWTRYSVQDGYYVRFENTVGTTGGSNSHTHTISGSTGAAVGTGLASRGGGSQTTAALSTHTHTVNGATPSEAVEPPYIEVILGKLDSDGAAPNGLITMWSDEAPGGWLDESSTPSDPFFGRFLKASATYGTTGGSATHTHANVTGLSTDPTTNTTNARTGSSGSSATHVHSVSVTDFSTTNNLPPYITAVFAKRQGTDPVYNQFSSQWYVNTNAQTPTDPWPVGVTDLGEREAISTTTTLVKRDDVVRLRLNLGVTNATSTAGTTFTLQYAAGDTCTAIGSWTNVGASGSSTAVWRGYDNGSVTTGGTLSTLLLSSSTVAATYEEDGSATSTPNDIEVDAYGEWDFVLEQHDALAGTNYCFRLVESDGTPLGTYTHYPQLMTDRAPNSATHEALFDNEKTATTTPFLTFVTTDPEGAEVQYQVQIDTDYSFASPLEDKTTISNATQFVNLEQPADKAPFTSGQLMQFDPALTMSNGTTYWWRVRALDPGGSNEWGDWSTPTSFTIDTSLSASAWYQTTDEQFETNALTGVVSTGSGSVDLATGSTTGTMTSAPIVFSKGTSGTAWDSFHFSDIETTGDVKYTLEYYTDAAAWALIPDTDLSGNSAGFDTSPVSLLNLDTDTYSTLRIVATLTDSGGSPSIQDWGIDWGYRVETPTLTSPFANEKVSTTTPELHFSTTDPQSDSLTYQVEWSTDYTFSTATTRTSDTDTGFTNSDTGADTDPFISGDAIVYTIQSADALTDGTTYWWRVRAKDTTGDNAYSFWSEPQSFTVDSGVTVSTWFQTTQEQFATNILSGALPTAVDTVTVATTAAEAMLVYGQGTETSPRYRQFTGSTWSAEGTLGDVGAPVAWARVQAGTTREEYVAVTVGTDADVNAQIFANGAWSDLQELTTTMGNVNARGFDVTYETLSGDALVAYCDGDADPSYAIWNGTSWSAAGTINVGSANSCEWIELASDPVSDEIIVLVRDSSGGDYEAQVWNGSAWGNATTLGTVTEPAHAGMAVGYEASGNQAIVISSDGNPARFRYNTWNGTAWGGVGTQSIGDDFEWGSLVADDGTDQMLLCYQDEDTNIGVVRWNGTAWTGQTELLSTTGKSKTDPGFSCVFETTAGRDGYAVTAYTDTTQTNYSIWNTSTWSAGTQISTLGDTITSTLERTGVGLILGLFFDETNDRLMSSNWDGSSWSTAASIEDDASVNSSPYGHPYAIAPRNPGREGTTIVSPGIEFTDGVGPYWQDFLWNDTVPGSSSIVYQVQYYDGSAWAFIPDGDLSGNSAGYTTGPIDLSGLNKDTYHLIRPYATLSCDGSGNCPELSDWTVRWAEGITVSGTLDAYNQVTPVTGGTIEVAVNGVLQSGKTGTVTGGVWSISNVTVFPGDVVTVFVSGAADQNEAVGVTRYDGVGNITDFALYERHLALGSGDVGADPLTNSDIGSYTVTQDEDVFIGFAGGTLSACATTGCDDVEITIASTTTYRTDGPVSTHDIENNGTFISTTTVQVSGSWDNNATTTLTGSTVYFVATSTAETIDNTGAASSAFHAVTFATTTSAATWTPVGELTTAGALTLTSGTLDRDAVPLTVGASFTIGASGVLSGSGTTTFAGATAATWSDQNPTAQNFGDVVVNGAGKVVTLGSDVLVESLSIAGGNTLDVSSGNYTLMTYGDVTNAGTFLTRSGTLDVAATTTAALTLGSSNLYNLTVSGSGATSFTEADVTLGHDLTLTAGTLTLPTGTLSVGGSFTNSGGAFAHNNATVAFTGSGTNTITLDGTAFTNALYNASFTGVGSYTFTDANATTTNDVLVSAGTVTFPSGTLTVGGSLTQSAGIINPQTGTVQFTTGSTATVSTASSLYGVTMAGVGTLTFGATNATLAGDLTTVSGTTVLPSGTLTLGGSLSNSATLDPQTGTIRFVSTDPATITTGGAALYVGDFDSTTGAWTLTDGASFQSDLALTAGTWTLNSGNTLTVDGTFTNSIGGASTTWTGTTLTLTAGTYSGNQKTDGGDTYDTVTVSGSAQVTFWNSTLANAAPAAGSALYFPDYAGTDGSLHIYGDYTRSAGTEYWRTDTDFDGTTLGTSSRAVAVQFADGASASLTGATLDIAGTASSAVAVAALSGTYTLSVSGGTTSAEYYHFADLGSTGLTLSDATTVVTLDDGAYTVAAAGGSALTLSSTTIDANPALQIQRTTFATTTAISAFNVSQTDAVPSSYWWFRNGAGNLYGESYDNDDGDPGSIRFDDSSLVITVSGTVYTDAGSTAQVGGFCDGSTAVISVVVEGGATYTGSCDASTGAYSIGGVVVIGDPTISIYLNGSAGVDGSVITKTPTGNITDADIYQHRVILRHEDTEPLSIADMATFDSTNDAQLHFTAATSTSGDSLTVTGDTELYLWPTRTFTPGGTVTVLGTGTGNDYDGSLYLAATSTFTGTGTTTVSVGGTFTQAAGAQYVPASTTLAMTATTSGKAVVSATGDILALHNLAFTGSDGSWNTQGVFSLTGDMLVATGTVTGTADITLHSGSLYGDGLLSLGGGTVTINESNTLGGVQPWTFNNLALGSGSVVGTTTLAANATTTVGGVFTIANAHFFTADSSTLILSGAGTVFIEDGTFLAGTGTVRYTGTGSTVLGTEYYNLTLDAPVGTATYTASGIGMQVFNDLTVGGSAASTFTLATNNTALAVSGDLLIASGSTLIASPSAFLTLAGSWTNAGTFIANAGTVTLTGSGSVDAGASPFASLTVDTTGTVSIAADATTTDAFTLAAAGSFTVTSGHTLAVSGSFFNAVGGAATTWTGSTLSLSAAGSQLINAATTSDQYATLSIADGSHVRMWNSDASTVSTATGGSLYSMDHAGVNGDLYIYGDYQNTSTPDYWSYATDFDGTPLGGGARPAAVYFESGSTATYSGTAELSVGGAASASTTLQNQGVGTYTVTIGGTASTTMSHYVVRDTDVAGLVFSGDAVVNDLSYGDFLVTADGASAITVGGSAITASPARTFTENTFVADTGVTGAYNVTATGTAVSSWRFTNHHGNLAGESFDNDPDGDPGYLVWDDSAASITISGTVYSDEGVTTMDTGVCDGSQLAVAVRVAGLTTYTSSCDASGNYSVSGVTYSPGDSIVAYLTAVTGDQGATITVDPVSNINNFDIYQDRVIVRHESTAPITIDDLAVWDSSDDANIPFTAVSGTPDTLTLPADRKLLVWTAKTFAPGGDVTVSGGGAGDVVDGTLGLYTNALWQGAGDEDLTIGGNLELASGASISASTGTTTFTSTVSGRTVDTNGDALNQVVFSGSGAWTLTGSSFAASDVYQQAGTLTYPVGTTTIAGSLVTSGGSFTEQGPMVFTGTGTHELAFNGSTAGALTVSGTGAYTMSDATVTVNGGLSKTGGSLVLPTGTLALSDSFRNESGTVTHSDGTVAITTTASSTVVTNGSDLGSLSLLGGGDLTMVDTDLTLTGDLSVVNGQLTMATGTVAIGGSLVVTAGGFEHASGTVLFNSADSGEVVTPNGSDFYSVVFASPTGGWTVTESATTTHNFTLSTAGDFTLQSGATLSVGGVFLNSVGGVATTWTGSTLALNGGNTYKVNSKVAGGDSYGTLAIGPQSDISLWNSDAVTVTVDPSASLYSQDHGASNGALNIYGDYHIGTTTEYWRYDTDFDGASLSGSERAVTVRIASSSSVTVDGGALELVGVSGNETVVTNQGAGLYTIAVTAGDFDAQYYQFRNLDAAGLQLSGTPVITSLNAGDFELAVAGGTLMSLSSTTLNANASLLLQDMRFATTSAITGYNVTLTGVTSNAWTFVDHVGNLSGESYDIDGATACGSVRWDDSACLLTQQVHYRWRNDDGGIGVPDSEWYDLSWSKRQRVRVVNGDAATYSNAVVELTVPYDTDMQSDFDDLRFTDESGTTSVPFWVETVDPSTSATVWVQVPILDSKDTANLFMYYGNGSATSTSDAVSTFIAADDFEDGSLSEYSGDTSLFTAGTSFAYGGTYGLDNSGHESDKATDGIARFDQTVSQGETIRYMQYIDTSAGGGDETCTLFAVQSPVTTNQNYAVCLEQYNTDRVSIVKDVENTDSTGTLLASTTISYTTGWYEVTVDWATDGSIDVAVRQNGSLAASVSTTDTTYTSGGYGFTYWFNAGGWDSFISRPLVGTQPTLYTGAEQSAGGATYMAALDTGATGYELGTPARLRVQVENSGLAISGKQYRLEYASLGSAPSCEAVGDAAYAAVPPQASCGSAPVCMESSSNVTNAESTTDLLAEAKGTFTGGYLVEDPSQSTPSMSIGQDEYTELEYVLNTTGNVADQNLCFRVTDAGTPLDTYLRVAELSLKFDPVISGLTFNDGLPISLLPGTTTRVYATATVTDLNGYTDFVSTVATSTMFSTSVAANCSPDDNNCYVSTTDNQCSYTNCLGNSCDLVCYADFYYFAEPTDALGIDWVTFLEVEDEAGGYDFDTSLGTDVQTLRAINVTQSIDYGALAASSTSAANNASSTVENIGNTAVDIDVEGTDLYDGFSSTIPVSNQKLATSTFDYNACVTCTSLSTSSSLVDVDLSKPVTPSPYVTDTIYWGIAIPFGVSSAPHSGTVLFTPVAGS